MAALQGSIQVWSQPAATWTGTNPVLLRGQYGHESDGLPASPKVKIGDGVTAWNALSYLGATGGGTWGSITGTLSDQTDLQNALDAKVSLTGAQTVTNKISISSRVLIADGITGNGYIQLYRQNTDVAVPATSAEGIRIYNYNGRVGFRQSSDTWKSEFAFGVSFTSDRLWTWPNASGTVITTGNLSDITGVGTVTTGIINTRINQRIQTVTSAATVTPNADTDDCITITAQAAALTIANQTGTPVNFQKLIIRIKDNGTARAITFGTNYIAMGIALPTTTVISKILLIGFIYDSVTSKWGCVAVNNEA